MEVEELHPYEVCKAEIKSAARGCDTMRAWDLCAKFETLEHIVRSLGSFIVMTNIFEQEGGRGEKGGERGKIGIHSLPNIKISAEYFFFLFHQKSFFATRVCRNISINFRIQRIRCDEKVVMFIL